MAFYPVEIDLCPGFGWQSIPSFNTDIRQLRSGREKRRGLNDVVRHRYMLPYQNITSQAYADSLKSAFLAMRGQLHTFLAKDASDYLADGDALGIAPSGSTPVQLVHVATFGAASYERTITKPVAAGLVVYQNGIAKPGTVDTLTGLFTPTTGWTPGDVLTWSGEFRVQVRFASDLLPMSIDDRFSDGPYAMNGSIELAEVFGE